MKKWLQKNYISHGHSLAEVTFISVVSLLPVLIGTLIGYVSQIEKTNGDGSYFYFLYLYLENGELFLYCTSVLATVLYLASLDRTKGYFPQRKWFVLVSVVCIALAIAFFTLKRVEFVVNSRLAFTISLVIYAISIVMYYFLTVIRNTDLPSFQKITSAETSNFIDNLKNRKQ